MKMVIAYSSLKNSSSQKIKSALYHCLPENEFEVHRSFNSLSGRLRKPGNGWHIALLSIDSQKELEKILSISALFSGARILLILPDRNQDMISKGLQLVPRLITYSDENFEELGAVLENMIRKIKIKNDRNLARIERQNVYCSKVY